MGAAMNQLAHPALLPQLGIQDPHRDVRGASRISSVVDATAARADFAREAVAPCQEGSPHLSALSRQDLGSALTKFIIVGLITYT